MDHTVADDRASPSGSRRRRTAAAIRDPLPWREFVGVAETLEETGYEAMFLPEIAGREAFATLAAVAGSTRSIRLGTGVVTIAARRTLTTAMAATTVHDVSSGRFVLGLGTGPSGAGALERLRTSVGTLRALLAGERVQTEDGSARLAAPPETPVPIWLAALGPRAVRLAGEVADGVLLNWCTPERVARAREEIDEGARVAGRDPASVTVAVYVRACVGIDATASLAALRSATADYAAIDAYRRQFERAGFGDEAAVAATAHRERSLARVPERLVRAVTVSGDAEEARAGLEAFRRAGADLPIVYPVAAPGRPSSLLGTIFALAPDPAVEG